MKGQECVPHWTRQDRSLREGFQGWCHPCGEWGHSPRCALDRGEAAHTPTCQAHSAVEPSPPNPPNSAPHLDMHLAPVANGHRHPTRLGPPMCLDHLQSASRWPSRQAHPGDGHHHSQSEHDAPEDIPYDEEPAQRDRGMARGDGGELGYSRLESLLRDLAAESQKLRRPAFGQRTGLGGGRQPAKCVHAHGRSCIASA